ncbi:zinc finger CCCH domain-containing protein 53-like isoform X2 [Henckelia pumila]|uniref:zinc finger CCCH domain-containing protein 53-like isoform X2 n=1 Tax=Henckelia pumila TaxID=405737 RepID=UPI003C6E140C
MDAYEATKTVMSRIQTLDPDNASKIMGYILLQDQGEMEMIRLAFGPEALLASYMNQAKSVLRLPSNNSSLESLSNPIRPSNTTFPQTSPRILIPNNGFQFPNPCSPAGVFPRSSPRPISYAAVLNGSNSTLASNSSTSPSSHFYGNNDFGDELLSSGGGLVNPQVQDQLPFVDESLGEPIMSPSGGSDSLVFPYSEDLNSISSPLFQPFHRRSCSVNDAAFLSNLEDGGGGCGFVWRPCVYFARGFCKNGSTCKFLHSEMGDGDVESPSKNNSAFDELLRVQALQQQRLAFMASGGHHPFAYNKCMTLTNENRRNDFSPLGFYCGGSSSSRQIYLTFPSDSTFKEEDVSGYFNTFGPVQDVRIPYQQKRMFGFVTFVYPETVKLILAKGNPHFVCDSRVLVKPYKEKGKILDKKLQHEQIEGVDYSVCLSPSEIDSRGQLDIPFGSRMLFGAQELMLRRKLEQEAELIQHAIELQGRRLMNLRLMDLKNHHLSHPFLPRMPSGYPHCSPRQSQLPTNQNLSSFSDNINPDVSKAKDDQKLALEEIESSTNDKISIDHKQEHVNGDESGLPESLDDILPDLFSSPTKLSMEGKSILCNVSTQGGNNIHVDTFSNGVPLVPISSTLSMASFKSCHFQMPRFSSGQEAIEM